MEKHDQLQAGANDTVQYVDCRKSFPLIKRDLRRLLLAQAEINVGIVFSRDKIVVD